MKRYELLAEEISALIKRGVLQPGARLPSVRDTARDYCVSQDTVYRAFYLLEGNGAIHARPRSGYFVNQIATHAAKGKSVRARRRVSVEALGQRRSQFSAADGFMFSVYERLLNPSTLPFGASYPGANLYPYASLARSLAAAARTLKPNLFNSGLSNGYQPLREQIALRYRARGAEVSGEDVVITSGASEAIALCLQSVTAPGDLVAVEDPCFHGTLHLLERLNLRHVAVPVDPRNGIDLNRLADVLKRQPVKACVLMTGFQNPTTVCLSEPAKQELVRLLASHGVPLVEDDVYAELGFSVIPPMSILAHDATGITLTCGSFSKSLAPGYRIGWVAAPPAFIERIRRLRLVTTITPSVPVQVGISHYLARGSYDRHLRSLKSALRLQLEHLLDRVQSVFPDQCRISAPTGGYYAWMQLPSGRSAIQIAQAALEDGISVMPGGVFSRASRFDNFLRINYGHPWNERAERGIRKLGRLIARD